MLVAYIDGRALVRRLDNDGAFIDSLPLVVSEQSGVANFVFGATADGTDFYVGWSLFFAQTNSFFGRRVPASGPLTMPAETIGSSVELGCRYSRGAPEMAPALTGGDFRFTWPLDYVCPTVLFSILDGVGDFFGPLPPLGNTSPGPAPIVRGANDVAAVWWNVFTESLDPLITHESLAASWIEPGTPTMIQLSTGLSSVPPALAAVGDTFVAVWAAGSEIRAVRFTRASGPLDPDGGMLVATGLGPIGEVAAAADGTNVVIAWRESAGPGQSAIRAIRLAPDGTLPSPTPTDVAFSTEGAAVSVAANPAAALVAFTRGEEEGNSIRAVLLDD